MFKHFTLRVFAILFFISLFFACHHGGNLNLPKDFSSYSDSMKVEWLTKKFIPDSVARLLCNDAARIDTTLAIKDFNLAVGYAYSGYDDSQREAFANNLNEYAFSLPSQYKMRIYYIGAKGNGRNLGYVYAADMLHTNGNIEKETFQKDVEALKSICSDNPGFVDDFVRGINLKCKEEGKNFDYNH